MVQDVAAPSIPPMLLLAVESGESFLLTILLQLIVIIAAARLGGWLFASLGQPQVVGEIATGLLLGPSCLGRFQPEIFHQIFTVESATVFMVLGQLGLIFLMFVIGMEFDFGHLKSQGRTSIQVALAGIILPFALGAAFASAIHEVVAPEFSRPGFVLFMATAMSITAIPILGRIMMEFGLTKTPMGALTISAAAVDDAAGWILLAAVSAGVQGEFQWGPVLSMLGLTIGFVVFALIVVRRFIAWAAGWWFRRQADLTLVPFSVIVLLVLASAAATNAIGVFSIFGPFVVGACLWDQTQLQAAVRQRLELFVTAFFLPVFFTYTGLRTDIGALSSTSLWIICGGLILTASIGKVVGCGLVARLGGMNWRDSASIAVMMNTRALMGLIAVNIGRDLGVVPDSVFCMMVLMAIATTLPTAPLLRRLQAVKSA